VRELTHVDPELADLVRERLDAREPRLPARFVPPPERPRRSPWVAAVVVAFALGFGIAVLVRPEVGTTVLSGLLGRPVVTTPLQPSAAPGSGGPAAVPSAGQRGAVPTGLPASAAPSAPTTTAPQASGAAGGTSSGGPPPTAAPAPQQSGGITIQVSLPPLLPTPAPTPAPTPRPSPTPTCLISLPPLCVRV
jgi:hypothetical protein